MPVVRTATFILPRRCTPLERVPPTRFLSGAEVYHGENCTRGPGAVTRFRMILPFV